jgi:hypothetical protein
MVSVLTSSALDHGFKPVRSNQTIRTCICCFSAKASSIKEKEQTMVAQNQVNVSVWSNMSTCRLL